MEWISLVLAGLCEMSGVSMITKWLKGRNWVSLILLIVSFGASFLFLTMSMKSISMGTAYAVWTGIGASGGAILGMLFYGEPKDWKRVVFIIIIIGATVGLKIVS
jgi:paired small multidrug resistance pump